MDSDDLLAKYARYEAAWLSHRQSLDAAYYGQGLTPPRWPERMKQAFIQTMILIDGVDAATDAVKMAQCA